MAAFARLIASGCGLGYAPRAPGTAGSLAAVLLAGVLLAWGPPALPVAALLAIVAGAWAIPAAHAARDPGWVVIDEVAGQWIAALGLLRADWSWHGWKGLLLAFMLFRALDIAKPGPVGWADRRTGPVWVMADDVIAGLIAAAVLLGAARSSPGAARPLGDADAGWRAWTRSGRTRNRRC